MSKENPDVLVPFQVEKPYFNNKPRTGCVQGLHLDILAEASRFELELERGPTIGFQDRPLKPLGYASGLFWWSMEGSDLRPRPYKERALTTELMDQRYQG
jgi:hypothetical protein